MPLLCQTISITQQYHLPCQSVIISPQYPSFHALLIFLSDPIVPPLLSIYLHNPTVPSLVNLSQWPHSTSQARWSLINHGLPWLNHGYWTWSTMVCQHPNHGLTMVDHGRKLAPLPDHCQNIAWDQYIRTLLNHGWAMFWPWYIHVLDMVKPWSKQG